MRVLVFGREPFVARLSGILSRHVVTSLELVSQVGMGDGPAPDGIGLALVDAMAPGADEFCRRTNDSGCVPLALVVEDGPDVDWEKLDRLKASGYVSGSAGDELLSARLIAMVRRLAQGAG